jgi:hypothetical protein
MYPMNPTQLDQKIKGLFGLILSKKITAEQVHELAWLQTVRRNGLCNLPRVKRRNPRRLR